MIDSIHISNFQKHKKLTIEFDPHLTVICGSSDQGKSSIIRAIRWVCLNKPSGDAFIRHGAKASRVTLKVDRKEISRRRGNGKNVYELEEQEYAALKQGTVPTEIESLLNVSDSNFQGQHDHPFWFMQTAGEVSRELNLIVNLDLIDKTLASVASELRRARGSVETSEARLSEARGQQMALQWVPEAEEQLQELEQLQERINEQEERTRKLETITRAIKETTERRDRLHLLSTNLRMVLASGERAKEQRQRVDTLQSLQDAIGQALSLASTQIPHEALEALQGLFSKSKEAKERYTSLKKLSEQIEEMEEQCQDLKIKHGHAETELKNVMEELEVCPLCYQKFAW